MCTRLIVAYDIPEEKRWARDLLRGKLEDLGFALLHKSLWVSPYNFLGDIEEIVKQYELENYVLLSISKQVGREPSIVLAERLWKLKNINEQYTNFIQEVKTKEPKPTEAILHYLAILNQDPQLPADLLPPDWQGKTAYKLYQKFVFKKGLERILSLMQAR